MSHAIKIFLLLIPLALVAECASSSVANVWSGPSDRVLDQLASQVPEASQANTFYADFGAPYPKVFAEAVKALKDLGDTVRLADSDTGYIATNRSQHWPWLSDSYATQYLVVIEKISATETRVLFKVLRWNLTFGPTDNLQHFPIASTLDVGAPQQWAADEFVSGLRSRL